MNRRSFLRLFVGLPFALPFVNKVKLPKIPTVSPNNVITICKWDGLGNSWKLTPDNEWVQDSKAPEYISGEFTTITTTSSGNSYIATYNVENNTWTEI